MRSPGRFGRAYELVQAWKKRHPYLSDAIFAAAVGVAFGLTGLGRASKGLEDGILIFVAVAFVLTLHTVWDRRQGAGR